MSLEDGFAIAAKVTSFDGVSDYKSIEDGEYGAIEFYLKWWDAEGVNFERLKERFCTEEDFNKQFFPLHQSFVGLVGPLKGMKCIEDPTYKVYGDYNSDKAANV